MAGRKEALPAGANLGGELRVPPHSVEAEQAVIGSLLIDGERAWPLVSSRVTAAAFYRPDHRLIFEAIAELASESKAVDVVTVSEKLERKGKLADAGGLAYLAQVHRDTPTAANASTYADIVRDRAVQRSLMQFARRLEASVWVGEGSAQEIATAAQEELLRLQASVRQGSGLISASKLMADLIDDIDRRAAAPQGLQLGLANFDELTGGLDAGDLVVIAGRPAMGKTALLVTVAANVARGKPVAVFSAEMPAKQLMRRCMAMATGISQRQLRRGEGLSDEQWARICATAPELGALSLHVDDKPAPHLTHIRAECAALKARGGLGLVMVDYLQLVQGAGRNRYEELRDVAYGLKGLAKELEVPVIALAQLNRDVERRGDDRRPGLSDLRDSGAIEEAADIIGMLYREGYYTPDFSMPYVLECNVVKHRNGELSRCLWFFAGERSLVTQLDSGAAIQYRRLLSEQRKARTGGVGIDL